MGDMAEYYDSRGDNGAEDDMKQMDRENYAKNALKRYEQAKNAEVGATISCPNCNKLIVKKTYNKTFCSNGRVKKGGNCKDAFWNVIDDRKSSFTGY